MILKVKIISQEIFTIIIIISKLYDFTKLLLIILVAT